MPRRDLLVQEETQRAHGETIRAFHDAFYSAGERGGTWGSTSWLGVPTRKNPFDLWVVQEMIVETRPEIIVECGTYNGGATGYFATLCDVLKRGEVISIDIAPAFPVARTAPTNTDGSVICAAHQVDPSIIEAVQARAAGRSTMVILDSDHSETHVARELAVYAPLVSVGQFLIVEDTNTAGPRDALANYTRRDDFMYEPWREKLLMTFSPGGYLRRIR